MLSVSERFGDYVLNGDTSLRVGFTKDTAHSLQVDIGTLSAQPRSLRRVFHLCLRTSPPSASPRLCVKNPSSCATSRFATISDYFNVVQRRVLDQFGDQDGVAAQDSLDLLRGGVAATEPDDLRWRSIKPTAFCKMAVLSDNAKAVHFGILPDLIVRRLIEGDCADMR